MNSRTVAVIILLVVQVIPLAAIQYHPVIAANPSTSQQGSLNQLGSVNTYGLDLGQGPTILNANNLKPYVNIYNLTAMQKFFAEYFVPEGIHQIVLDIGWYSSANTSTHFVAGGDQIWVNNFLNASELFGIKVFFFTRQWGYMYGCPSWDCDLLKNYPASATYNGSGTGSGTEIDPGCGSEGVCFPGWTITSPDVLRQLETDSKQLCIWYCKYPNWAGFGEGTGGDSNFYSGGLGGRYGSGSVRAFDNTTVSDYAQSTFFTQLINSSGYYVGTNTLSKIWQMFVSRSANYNTSSLAQEIYSYNIKSDGLLQGYNNWENYLQAEINVNLANWFKLDYNRQMTWITGAGEYTASFLQDVPNFNSSDVQVFDSITAGPIGCPLLGRSWCSPGNQGYNDFLGSDTQQLINRILGSGMQSSWIPWDSLGATLENRGDLTPIEMQSQYLYEVPLENSNPVRADDYTLVANQHGLLNMTQQQYSQAYALLMSRMQYNGGYYGTQKNAIRLLDFVGNLPLEFITPAANVTYDSPSDSNATQYGNLNQFNVILGAPANPTASYHSRLEKFVQNGGGFVSLSFPSGANLNPTTNWPGSQILGLGTNSSGATPTGTLTITQSNPITNPYSTISYTSYWTKQKITFLSNESAQTFLKDSNGNPYITANNYYRGRGVFLAIPYDGMQFLGNPPNFHGYGSYYGAPRDSWISLLINAIFYAADKQNMLPILWESSYSSQQNWSPYLQFSIDGTPGKPVLLWASNNDSVASNFDIHLSATFYDISTSGWVALDVQDMQVVASGTGQDIHISTTVPAKTWAPIYIMNATASSILQPLYSTSSVSSVSSSGSATTIATNGPANASSWLVLSSSSPIWSLSSSLTGTVPSYSSSSSLNQTRIGYYCNAVNSSSMCSSWRALSQQGWYYDQTNNLLFIHYRSGGATTLTISSQGSSTDSSTSQTTTSTKRSTTTSADSTSVATTTFSSTTTSLITSSDTTTVSSTSQPTSTTSSTESTSSTEFSSSGSTTTQSSTQQTFTTTVTFTSEPQSTVFSNTSTSTISGQSSNTSTIGSTDQSTSVVVSTSETSSTLLSPSTSTAITSTTSQILTPSTTSPDVFMFQSTTSATQSNMSSSSTGNDSSSDKVVTLSSAKTRVTSTEFSSDSAQSLSNNISRSSATPNGAGFMQLLGFVPFLSSSSPTPIGNAVFAYELSLIAGIPIVLRKSMKRS